MKLLEEYETSGLLQKEFAAKHDVSLNTLQYWLYKRTRRAPKLESNTPTKFLPVELVSSTALSARRETAPVVSSLVLELPTGARVTFPQNTPARFVAELLAALR